MEFKKEKMELQEAINHLKEKIKEIDCIECREEHKQLLEWLIELKDRREKSDE